MNDIISILLTALLFAPLAVQAEPAVSAALATFEERRHVILAAVLAQPERLTGGSPMHFWIAQRLFEQGEKDKAIATAMETALPADYPGKTLEESLQSIRKDILGKTKLGLRAVTGTYTDRFGETMEKSFDGPAKIAGKIVEYDSWPLVDNPWIHQDRGGNMTITDGITSCRFDVTNWTITEGTKE